MGKLARFNLFAVILSAFTLSACVSPGGSNGSVSGNGLVSAGPPGAPASPVARNYSTGALLFTGTGTWATEISALENLMSQNNITYTSVSSAQLDAMTVDDIAKYGMIIVPGGAGGTEAGGVSAQTHANLRTAVQQRGVSYLGFCAGAFVAVAPTPAAGQDVSYGFGVLNGPILNYPTEADLQNVTMAMTLASFPDGTHRDILWYGGPTTPNIPGGVVAKYPDGEPMITQAWSGNGFVMLSAVHPSVTGASLGLTDATGPNYYIAVKLMQSALNQAPLPAF